MSDAQCHSHVVQCDVLLGGARQPSGVFACASWTHVTGLGGLAHPLAITQRSVRVPGHGAPKERRNRRLGGLSWEPWVGPEGSNPPWGLAAQLSGRSDDAVRNR